MAIAGVVILYHPEENVIQNIRSYLPHLDRLYIADNTEHNISAVTSYFSADDKVKIICDGDNQGIAKRLNEAATLAIEEEYNWLLTMDQDSHFEEGVLPDYLLCAGTYLHKDTTAMFGVEYEQKPAVKECNGIETVHLITSGSILNLRLFAQVGGFDEDLFIDEVDLEYCYRAITKGYKIIRFANIFLNHNLGTVSYHKSLKNFATTPRVLHSPVRLYYMVRNFLYVQKKYGNTFAANDKIRRVALLHRIKNNLLYGKKRWKALRYLVKAVADYRTGKMGTLTL